MKAPRTKDEVQAMIDQQIPEDIHLDYKDSRALFDAGAALDKIRAELAKDVSAFANSDGGVIIYGVQEDKQTHLPAAIDSGIPIAAKINKEWLENCLNAISPRVDGLVINPIPISPTHQLFSIEIPKSFRAPHQARDNRYYKRFNFSSYPMEDYEVRDVLARQQIAPALMYMDVEASPRRWGPKALIIWNAGPHAAEDVVFHFPPEFNPWLDKRKETILVRGCKRFPAGRRFEFREDELAAFKNPVMKFPEQFELAVSYWHRGVGGRVTESFKFDLRDLHGAVTSSDTKIGMEEVASAIEAGTRTMSDRMEELAASIRVAIREFVDNYSMATTSTQGRAKRSKRKVRRAKT